MACLATFVAHLPIQRSAHVFCLFSVRFHFCECLLFIPGKIAICIYLLLGLSFQWFCSFLAFIKIQSILWSAVICLFARRGNRRTTIFCRFIMLIYPDPFILILAHPDHSPLSRTLLFLCSLIRPNLVITVHIGGLFLNFDRRLVVMLLLKSGIGMPCRLCMRITQWIRIIVINCRRFCE